MPRVPFCVPAAIAGLNGWDFEKVERRIRHITGQRIIAGFKLSEIYSILDEMGYEIAFPPEQKYLGRRFLSLQVQELFHGMGRCCIFVIIYYPQESTKSWHIITVSRGGYRDNRSMVLSCDPYKWWSYKHDRFKFARVKEMFAVYSKSKV